MLLGPFLSFLSVSVFFSISFVDSSLEKSSGDCYGFEVLANFLEWRG